MPSFEILVSTVLVLSCGQTDRHTDRITDVDNRCTHATAVSNNISLSDNGSDVCQRCLEQRILLLHL